MTQEEKDLLLKDLCARLRHKVRIKIGEYSDYTLIGIVVTDEQPIKVEVIESGISYKIEVSPDIVKPYLRPMSSMTEEEKKEFYYIGGVLSVDFEFETYKMVHLLKSHNVIDWLNEHHFDYRGLIEKNLALDCTGLHIYD